MQNIIGYVTALSFSIFEYRDDIRFEYRADEIVCECLEIQPES